MVYYTTFPNMIEGLAQEHLYRRWKEYLRLTVLVIHEIGFRLLNRQKAKQFLRPISHCGITLTITKYFSSQGELLSGNVLVQRRFWTNRSTMLMC